MKAESARVRVPKTADVVAAALRREIIRGEFFDGEVLPTEAELLARYGVSRPSLREALRILESEKLVYVRRGNQGGVQACRPSVSVAANYLGMIMESERVTLADVFAARVAIEPVAVRLLAGSPKRDKAIEELREILAQEDEVLDDAEGYATTTQHFHHRLVELSGNKTLALLWGTLQYVVTAEVRDIGLSRSARRRAERVEAVEHMFSLVEAGDADAAEAFWRDLMGGIAKKVVAKHGSKTLIDVLG